MLTCHLNIFFHDVSFKVFCFFHLYFYVSKFLIIFKICFWLSWVFVAACGLSLAAVSGDYSLVVVCRLLTVVASLVVDHGLQALWAL